MNKKTPEKVVREIRRKTRRRHEPEEKIRIVLEGLRGEDSISEICRKEGIAPNQYYSWSKEFLEAGKQRLAGDTKRQANTGDVSDLRKQNAHLKQMLAEMMLKNNVLKKSVLGSGSMLDDE